MCIWLERSQAVSSCAMLDGACLLSASSFFPVMACQHGVDHVVLVAPIDAVELAFLVAPMSLVLSVRNRFAFTILVLLVRLTVYIARAVCILCIVFSIAADVAVAVAAVAAVALAVVAVVAVFAVVAVAVAVALITVARAVLLLSFGGFAALVLRPLPQFLALRPIDMALTE